MKKILTVVIFILISGIKATGQVAPVPTQNGGTGTNIPPTVGQVPIGQANGQSRWSNAPTVDITQPPFLATCDNPNNPPIDVSQNIHDALATGREVVIPACPGNPTWPWIFSADIIQRNGIACAGGALIRAPINSDYLIRISSAGGYTDGCTISDTTAVAQKSNVVRTATVASGGTWGSTNITIVNADGVFKVGQRFYILLDDGGWFADNIVGVTGNTINFTKLLPYTAANGNAVWASNGLIWVGCGANQFRVSNTTILGAWANVSVNCPTGTGGLPPSAGTIFNLNMNKGQLFGLWCGSGCSANLFNNINFVGGWINAFTISGNGATTTFPLNGFRAWSNNNAATNPQIKINNVSKTYPVDWAFSTDGMRIIFTTAPPNGVNNISISYRVFSVEGIVIDTTGGSRASGDIIMGIESGQADIPCKYTGGLGNVINQVIIGGLCGPGFDAAIRFDNTGAVFIGAPLSAANSYNSISIIHGSSVKGDLVSIPTLSTTMVTGLPGLPFVSDPQGTYTGDFDNQTSFGSSTYDRGKLTQTIGFTQQAYTTATCIAVGDTPPGSKQIHCPLATPWVANTVYTIGNIRSNNNNLYIVTTGGTSALSGGPSGIDTSITDGTVVWNYVSSLAGLLALPTATGNGIINLFDLNITAAVSGTWVVGQAIYANIGIAGTIITADAGGGGGIGHYTLNVSQVASSRALVQGWMPQYDTIVGYGADGVISLSDRTGAVIPNGTILNWGGPAQPNGNLSAVSIPYQHGAAPLDGDTVTFGPGIQFAMLQPSTPLNNLTIQMPTCDLNLDGLIRGFATTAAITTLSVTAVAGTTVIGAPTSLTGGGTGGRMSFICRGGSGQWFPN